MKKKKNYKAYCFVKECPNTSDLPEKLFFSVPLGSARKDWWKICNRQQTSLTSPHFICEDHFTLEEDVAEWQRYTILKQAGLKTFSLKLKKGVKPTKFQCRQSLDATNLVTECSIQDVPTCVPSNSSTLSDVSHQSNVSPEQISDTVIGSYQNVLSQPSEFPGELLPGTADDSDFDLPREHQNISDEEPSVKGITSSSDVLQRDFGCQFNLDESKSELEVEISSPTVVKLCKDFACQVNILPTQKNFQCQYRYRPKFRSKLTQTTAIQVSDSTIFEDASNHKRKKCATPRRGGGNSDGRKACNSKERRADSCTPEGSTSFIKACFSNVKDCTSAKESDFSKMEIDTTMVKESPVTEAVGSVMEAVIWEVERSTSTPKKGSSVIAPGSSPFLRGSSTIPARRGRRIQETFEICSDANDTIRTDVSDSTYAPSANVSTYSASSSVKEYEDARDRQNLFLLNMKLMESNPKTYLGLNEDALCILPHLENKMKCSRMNIMIVLRKIRLHESHEILGHVFNRAKSTISEIISDTLPKLAAYLSGFVRWPPRNIIKSNVPTAFRSGYSDVDSIIDCFEVQMEKYSDPKHQSLSWSSYKKCNTVKFLISTTPDGLITFVSKAFGGRATDVNIVEHSGYLEKLPPNSKVMTDRGFKELGALLSRNGSRIIRPPSVKADVKMSKKEVIETKVIASLRILVERSIGRVRNFKLLQPHSRFHHDLMAYINHIVVVACALTNLQGPYFN